jgi:hypothetical protein
MIGACFGTLVSSQTIYINVVCIYDIDRIQKGGKEHSRLSKSYLILLSVDNVITKIPIKTIES